MRRLTVLWVVGVAACSAQTGAPDAGATDAGATMDASVTMDAGTDGGAIDAGVPPPRDGGFPHEPAGFVVLGEWNDEAGLVADGWYDDGNPSMWGSKTRVTSGYAGAPQLGGPAVIQTFYAGGTAGGYDPGREQFNLPSGTRELFFGAELQFKADYPTSTSSGGNKQLFVTFTGGGRYFVNLDEGAAAGKWGVYQQSTPLADSTIDVAYGRWVLVEWYLRKDTGAGDGVMRLWIDGVLALDLTNLTFPAGDMVLAYDDGSNNGNHYPLATDPRLIGTDQGGPVDAYRWAAVLRVSAPP